MFPSFISFHECSVGEAKVTLIKGRWNISEDTSCTTLFSRGTPYWVWANCPNGIFYVQMLGKYRKADQLFLVSRRIFLKKWSSLLTCAYTCASITAISCLTKDCYLFPVIYLGKDICTAKSFAKTKQQLWRFRSQMRKGERITLCFSTFSFN